MDALRRLPKAEDAVTLRRRSQETRRIDGCTAVGLTVSRVGDADGEWIPASRLLISASERVIQALVAYISRRHAGIHPPSAFEMRRRALRRRTRRGVASTYEGAEHAITLRRRSQETRRLDGCTAVAVDDSPSLMQTVSGSRRRAS